MSQIQRSPDGTHWWDGEAWQPLPPAPARPYWTGRKYLVAGGALLASMLMGTCIGAAGASGSKSAPAAPAAQAVTSSTSTPAASTPTPTPKPTPTPVPKQTPLTLSGQGSKVVEFDLPRGSYRLTWSAQGHDNFIVRLEGSESSGLVNEIPPEPSSGQAFVRLGGGHYALNVKASTLTWTIVFEPIG